MDAARYARVRELFLAADELSPQDQEGFLLAQTDADVELIEEVRSLLREHDPESAKREGDRPLPVSYPPRGTSKRGSPRVQLRSSDRVPDQATSRSSVPNSRLWAQQARLSRRRNNKWLWLAALLPTALIGWFTYHRVNATMEQSVRDELRVIADSVSHASRRYLVDKTRLVQSWTRQTGIHAAVAELVKLADENSATEAVQGSLQADQIDSQLRQLSGAEEVKFVVWSDNYRALASTDEVVAPVGSMVAPRHAEMLARVMSGETVVLGPERSDNFTQPEEAPLDPPVMAIIVPVSDDDGRVIAAFQVRGIDMFDEFSRIFFDVASAGNLDAYAVNQAGVMLTESPHAATLASMRRLDTTVEEIAARLRIADPGELLTVENLGVVQRELRPLTVSVASATTARNGVRIIPYRNYAGQDVVGAWRWNNDSQLGMIVERQADVAFATVKIVRSGFLLLGTLLFITASVAAAFLARATTAERVAVHPLSRYEVLRELGSGGMGVVYLARHRQLGRETAMKVMMGGRRHQEDQRRFDREARLAASLSNPHSVMIYDYGRSEDGESYCVMEFLRGLTLQQVVDRSGPQPVGRVLSIVSQVCEALAEAHERQLLHRDIKPPNIMLSLDRSVGDWAVLFDYGLAKPLEPVMDLHQTSDAHWSGTPMYMAPERFRQPNVTDPRSDIYSLGCVGYFLLAGRPPFNEHDAESLFVSILSEQPASLTRQRKEAVPDDVAQLIATCMAKSTADRFESITELSRAVDAIRGRHPWSVEEARQWWTVHGEERVDSNRDSDS